MPVSEPEKTLLDIRNSLNDINQQVAHKKKTTKWKATLTIHQNGGSGEDVMIASNSIIYNQMYKDVMDYWKGELLK